MWLAQTGRLRLAYAHHDARRIELVVRRLLLGQLDARDAERPDVGARVVPHLLVRLARDYLRRHPVGRADERVATLQAATTTTTTSTTTWRSAILCRDAKVGELDGAALGQQDVARLHVAMDDKALVVQVDERLERLAHHELDLRLAQRLVQVEHERVDGAARAELDEHPELRVVVVGLVDVHDVLVLALGEYVDLDHVVVELVQRALVDYFGGGEHVRLTIARLVHLAEGAVAQLAHDLPHGRRVLVHEQVGVALLRVLLVTTQRVER